jgi:hypothetical protein
VKFASKTCPKCNNEFTPYYESQKHCSRTCWLQKYNAEDREHGLRGAQHGSEAMKKRRGTSRGGNAYIKEDQRHQHRVVAERELSRALTVGEVVHHVDENRKNNDPLNLLVFPSQSEHLKHHQHMKYGKECRCSFISFKK